MNRIDTKQAPEQLGKALSEFTGKKVSELKLGKPYEIEGGGMGRTLDARLDGKPASFIAIEQKGQVGIYDARFSPHAAKVHEILGRSTEHSQTNKATQAGASALAWPERKIHAPANATAARVRRH